MKEFSFLERVKIFRESLREQREAIRDFWDKAHVVLAGSDIRLRPLPRSWTMLGHNHFSVLFIAVFHLLGISPPRRRLYARINHCLRVWVTACDNLLDGEIKETILTDLPPGARIFKSAHTLLVADRVFFLMLREAEASGVISDAEAKKLLSVGLNALTASGRQEAEEEHGISDRLRPADVLRKVHGRKAGMLFTAPLASPAALGDVPDGPRADDLRLGLYNFGLGVQILDDLNDLGDDLARHRQNYQASLAAHGDDFAERRLLASIETNKTPPNSDTALWMRFPKAYARAQKDCRELFETGIDLLCRGGLPLTRKERAAFLAGLNVVSKNPPLAIKLRAR